MYPWFCWSWEERFLCWREINVDYEDEHFVFDTPSPIEAIKYRMEQKGITNKDLATVLGYKSRVTDIFNNNRKLNLNMIRKLHDYLNIPVEVLIREY